MSKRKKTKEKSQWLSDSANRGGNRPARVLVDSIIQQAVEDWRTLKAHGIVRGREIVDTTRRKKRHGYYQFLTATSATELLHFFERGPCQTLLELAGYDLDAGAFVERVLAE